jgi:hypothetical protein
VDHARPMTAGQTAYCLLSTANYADFAFFFGAAVFFFAGPHVPHLAISASSHEGTQGRRIVQRREGGSKRHSYRSAVIGSTRDARSAGTNPAPRATRASRQADAANTAGSYPFSSKSSD